MGKRAEAAALRAYPNVEQPVWDESYPKTLFVRHAERKAFIKGYEQAEKNLALIWEDMHLAFKVINTAIDNCEGKTRQEVFQEAARLFNEQRQKN